MTRAQAFLTIVLLTSCRSPQPSPAAAVPTVDLAAEEARRLCLWQAEGVEVVDRQMADLRTSIARTPKKVDLWILLGRAWVRKAREAQEPSLYLNAARCADVALAIVPESALAHTLQAMVRLNEHRFAEAAELVRGVLARDPDDPLALGILSDAELELGHFDAAVAAAQKMVDLKPSLPAYTRASYLARIRGDRVGAQQMIRMAIKAGAPDGRDPEPTAWAIVQAAQYFFEDRDLEGADAGFDVALKTLPDYPPALVGKGRVALARGDGRAARTWLEKAYARSPLVETAWLLGDARALAGDPQGAEEAWGWVVRDGRRHDRLTLARFLVAKGRDRAEARRLLEEERRTRRSPDVEKAWAALGG